MITTIPELLAELAARMRESAALVDVFLPEATDKVIKLLLEEIKQQLEQEGQEFDEMAEFTKTQPDL